VGRAGDLTGLGGLAPHPEDKVFFRLVIPVSSFPSTV